MMIMMMALIFVKLRFVSQIMCVVFAVVVAMPVEQIIIEMANGFNIDRILKTKENRLKQILCNEFSLL